MERMMDSRRQLSKKKLLRLMVIGLIYLTLLIGAVVLFLGCVWFLKNTGYGWLLLSLLCLVTGGWLFFHLDQERQSKNVRKGRKDPGVKAGLAA